jgi:hypothetical protein
LNPEKGKGALQAPIPKLTRLAENSPGHSFTQACRHSVTRTERLPYGHRHFWRHLSLSVGPLADARRCVVCGKRVDNANLGGYDGRSARTGPVWCVNCADYALQLVLVFGGNAQ